MSAMNVVFNSYIENDFSDLREMIFQLYDEDPEGLPITEDKIIKTVNENFVHPEKVQIIMIHDGAKNIGYGIITFLWSNEYGGDVINIDELYVKKEYRNRRAASGLIRHLFESYTNVVLFELETTPSNQGALRLYENYGFEVSTNTHLIRAAEQATPDH